MSTQWKTGSGSFNGLSVESTQFILDIGKFCNWMSFFLADGQHLSFWHTCFWLFDWLNGIAFYFKNFIQFIIISFCVNILQSIIIFIFFRKFNVNWWKSFLAFCTRALPVTTALSSTFTFLRNKSYMAASFYTDAQKTILFSYQHLLPLKSKSICANLIRPKSSGK